MRSNAVCGAFLSTLLSRGMRPSSMARISLRIEIIASQNRSSSALDSDGTHARSASAMGNAEGLVQVEVAEIGAVIPRPRQPDLRVEIGAIEVNLPAACVDDVADGADLRLEHPMRRRICHHQHGQTV